MIVYLLGLLKALKTFFICALFAVLMAWNGIYTSLVTPHLGFVFGYWESYLLAYVWGAAIVLFVNLAVFPHSAEKELRMTLVTSLDHIRTFMVLIDKTYNYDITDDQVKVRDQLAQSIRANFSMLKSKLNETFIEINYSKWSISDYAKMVQLTRSMQQSLISAHSSLTSLNMSHNGRIFRQNFLTDILHNPEPLRKLIYIGLTEVQRELAVGKEWASLNLQEIELLKEIDLHPQDLSRQPSLIPKSSTPSGSLGSANSPAQRAEAELRVVQDAIASEIELVRHDPVSEAYPSPSLDPKQVVQPALPRAQLHPPSLAKARPLPHPPLSAHINHSIQAAWERFQDSQYQQIGVILQSGRLYHPDEPLFASGRQRPPDIISLETRLSSSQSRSGYQRLSALGPIIPPSTHPNEDSSTPLAHSTGAFQHEKASPPSPVQESNDLHLSCMRVYSYSFPIKMFLNELMELHNFTIALASDPPLRRKRIHFHVFEGFQSAMQLRKPRIHPDIEAQKDEEVQLSMREALDVLEGRQHVPPKVSFLERVVAFEQFLRGPDSTCAFKVACAVLVMTVLFRSDKTRSFALNYGLTSSIITFVVAITPTCGQSWLSFMMQISGQGIGLLYGMVILEIFHNVGGYLYNPFGLVCALGLFAILPTYLLYYEPQLFLISLLALNSAAVLVCRMFLLGSNSPDRPPERMAKSFVSLGVAILLVGCFQLLLIRNPARRKLRLALAKLMKANTAYTVILQSYVKATVPAEGKRRVSQKAIQRVANDLMERERQIQSAITALMPLMKFASVEPSFIKPFDATAYLQIIRANQLILDRNREARVAIGTDPLPDFIVKEFVEKLVPYRHMAVNAIKTNLYLCTSTLQSKFPLPDEQEDQVEDRQFQNEMFHDALVLSCRLTQTPYGVQLVKSHDLARYWQYIRSTTNVMGQLEAIKRSALQLFGCLEDDPFNYSKFHEL